MTRRLVTGALVGALATIFAGGLAAQTTADPKGYVPGTAPCTDGYVCRSSPTPEDGVVKSATYNGTKGLAGNLCVRTAYWAPAMATIECDPDLVPKPRRSSGTAAAAAAAAAAARTGAAGREDHACCQGAVRFRQGSAEA